MRGLRAFRKSTDSWLPRRELLQAVLMACCAAATPESLIIWSHVVKMTAQTARNGTGRECNRAHSMERTVESIE